MSIDYVKFIKENKQYIIIDNSLFKINDNELIEIFPCVITNKYRVYKININGKNKRITLHRYKDTH